MAGQIHDEVYLKLVQEVFKEGVLKGDRTGTGTISTFGSQMKFDLSGGSIPLLTTKKMFTRGIIEEILWYLQGNTNIGYLTDNNVHIWDEWADSNGDLGPVYGKQWRNWSRYIPMGREDEGGSTFYRKEGIDQIARVIDNLKNNPDDRRMIVCSWNVGELQDMALPPCHAFFQFWAAEGKLRCKLTQRSCDVGLGVPFNIVQYSILTHMIAQVCGLEAEQFIWSGGDVHIYTNHVEQLQEQLTRTPFFSPTLKLNSAVDNIDDFRFNDFEICDYQHQPLIKMDVAI